MLPSRGRTRGDRRARLGREYRDFTGIACTASVPLRHPHLVLATLHDPEHYDHGDHRLPRRGRKAPRRASLRPGRARAARVASRAVVNFSCTTCSSCTASLCQVRRLAGVELPQSRPRPFAPRMQQREDGRNEEERRHGSDQEPADHGAAERPCSCSPPSPSANAIGSMPMIMASAVMRTGRKRL